MIMLHYMAKVKRFLVLNQVTLNKSKGYDPGWGSPHQMRLFKKSEQVRDSLFHWP